MAFEILESTEQNVTKFKEIYEQDRFKARIFCFEHTPQEQILSLNTVSPGNFQIFRSTKKYGVSKTMKLYARKTDNTKYIVSAKGFYRIDRGRLMPMCLANIEHDILPIFIKEFSWIKFLSENSLTNVLFNTVIRYKLYSREKVLRHIYKCPPAVALIIKDHFSARDWKTLKQSVTNVENFNIDLIDDIGKLTDTIHLAFKMNQFVNLSWSARRLTEQHDKWSKEFTEIVLELTNRPLNIHPVFKRLNDFWGGGLLTTTKDLALEGNAQKHCVAYYSSHVDSGKVAIFHIDGYTAEIRKNNRSLDLVQLKGFCNKDAPIEVKTLLKDRLNLFTVQNLPDFDLPFKVTENNYPEVLQLPF